MQLPFTERQFLEVFAAYNSMFWWMAILLWGATSLATLRLIRSSVNAVALTILAAFHWAWSGVAYHALFFTAINPAAWGFAALFLIQAAAFVWFGVLHRQLAFRFEPSGRGIVGLSFLVYSLLYPAAVLLAGFRFPAAPGFAVPCPTTLFTVGLLLSAQRPVPLGLLVVPFVWSLIGGSAALTLGVIPDLMMFVGGAAILVDWAWSRGTRLAMAA